MGSTNVVGTCNILYGWVFYWEGFKMYIDYTCVMLFVLLTFAYVVWSAYSVQYHQVSLLYRAHNNTSVFIIWMPNSTAPYYACVRVTCSCLLLLVGHLLELRCISWDDITRYRFRYTAMCRIVITLPGTCCVSVPLSYLRMSRTTHGVRKYSCVKLGYICSGIYIHTCHC